MHLLWFRAAFQDSNKESWHIYFFIAKRIPFWVSLEYCYIFRHLVSIDNCHFNSNVWKYLNFFVCENVSIFFLEYIWNFFVWTFFNFFSLGKYLKFFLCANYQGSTFRCEGSHVIESKNNSPLPLWMNYYSILTKISEIFNFCESMNTSS